MSDTASQNVDQSELAALETREWLESLSGC
jgi:hypothetical protein